MVENKMEYVAAMFGLREYLIRLENRELWWVKCSDIEVIVDD